jgi:DNA gyrase subunit A
MPDETTHPNRRVAARPAGTPLFAANEKIAKINVADEIKNSFLDYSMSVIISRALPDVRDGLKPSQRRILYAMHELSLFPPKQAHQVREDRGDTIGNYHPHGEAGHLPDARPHGPAVGDAREAHRWQGQLRLRRRRSAGGHALYRGPPDASRRALMQDMDKDTVDFVPNYDERLTEPTVFPAAFPNLLVNGGTGIAVGMATNMPPHNLGEVIDGVCAQIDNPQITIRADEVHQGPGFPDGRRHLRHRRHQATTSHRPRQREASRQGRRRGTQGQPRADRHHRDSLQRQPRRAGERIAESRQREDHHRHLGDAQRVGRNCRLVIELKRDAVAEGRHQQPLQAHAAGDELQRQHAGHRRRPPQDAQSQGNHRSATSSTAARSSCAARASSCARPRSGRKFSKATSRAANLDEFIRIIRGSRNRDEAKVKLLAFEWTRARSRRGAS